MHMYDKTLLAESKRGSNNVFVRNVSIMYVVYREGRSLCSTPRRHRRISYQEKSLTLTIEYELLQEARCRQLLAQHELPEKV